jgi:hypothetical protein
MCIPHDSILGWADSYRRETSIEECKDKGFDCLEVMTKMEGAVICPWKRAEFEKHYDDHYDAVARNYIQSCEKRILPIQEGAPKKVGIREGIVKFFGKLI